eukprot:365682-Chlamydomonas_euryale.AAC.19
MDEVTARSMAGPAAHLDHVGGLACDALLDLCVRLVACVGRIHLDHRIPALPAAASVGSTTGAEGM